MQRTISVEETRYLAAEIGNAKYPAGAQTLAALLDNNDEIVRHNAVSSLAFHLKEKSVKPKLLQMLVTDEDPDNRDVAAAGLGNLFQSSKDHEVMNALGKSA